jgi:predicted transcriptional regulator of viral defense system
MTWMEMFRELSGAAARQQGLVTAAQAERLGVSAPGLRELIDAGLLWELDWSVFQVAGSPVAPRYAYPFAAWLALVPDRFRWERPKELVADAVLSHESACQLWGLGSAAAPSVVFTAPYVLAEPRAVDVRVDSLTGAEVTTHHEVPVTTPHRTIVDLVRGWNEHGEVRRALTDAVIRDLVDLGLVYRDLVPLAQRHQIPVSGPEFAGYLLDDLDENALSLRNQHAYTALVTPNR